MPFPRLFPRLVPAGLAGLLGAVTGLAAEPTPETVRQLPPAATRKVDFQKDVRPILEDACVKCHGRGKAKGGWRLDTRGDVLRDGESGPAVRPGDSARSHLIHLVAGTDPDSVMPEKGTRLTPAQVGILRAWIDQDLAWEPGVTFAKPPVRNLTPVAPPLPEGRATHPADRFLEAYLKRHGRDLPAAVDDRAFARRVWLDLVGLLPDPAELEGFLKDRSKDKRERLVGRLLADDAKYAQHWLSFWNDLLRNDYKGTGYIDGGRKQISPWLYRALRDNLPYDRFVRELVDPKPESEGFTKGIVWRGAVNASMTPPMQAAQNIGQVLMGVNLKCASCHDSFIDDWQLADAYGLAGIYSDGSLEMVQCDRPTGKHAPLKFLFPELGAVDPKAPRAERLKQLAGIITRPENGRLSRTVVNRLWARLLGRGLVEPLDVMQNEAWDPALLDWLAEDLVSHGWDLKRTLALIATSRAYQLPSVDVPEKVEAGYVFAGPAVRRLTAEQFRDALGTLTGIWMERPEGGLDRLLLETNGAPASAVSAAWVWGDPHAAGGVPPGTNAFRRALVLPKAPTEATFFVHADNSARLWVNGERVDGVDAPDWSRPGVYEARSRLKSGTNWIAVEAVNGGDGPNPAGLLVQARIRIADPKGEQVHDLGTDASWEVHRSPAGAWRRGESGSGWGPAQVLGGPSLAPWNVADALAGAMAGRTPYGRVRTALTSADPLQLALGRPNREQVTTVRQSVATTIQALELTNGGTLAKLLRDGAERLVQDQSDGRKLVDQAFQKSLCRPPTREELRLSVELVGRKPTREGVEDFLWSLAMLPEFQMTP